MNRPLELRRIHVSPHALQRARERLKLASEDEIKQALAESRIIGSSERRKMLALGRKLMGYKLPKPEKLGRFMLHHRDTDGVFVIKAHGIGIWDVVTCWAWPRKKDP